jgi:hypothetical protein
MDIAAIFRGDRCRVVFRKSSESPRNSSETARDKKKFADRTPSGAKMTGKTRFLVVNVRRKRRHSAPKRAQ